jgi:hypothetical protein
MDEQGDDVIVAIREAMDEEFVSILPTDRDINDDAPVFLKMRWAFRIAFVKGALWAKRRARERAKRRG